jgi:hypothetical protein
MMPIAAVTQNQQLLLQQRRLQQRSLMQLCKLPQPLQGHQQMKAQQQHHHQKMETQKMHQVLPGPQKLQSQHAAWSHT